MKDRITSSVFFLFLTALIIVSGVVLPRAMLNGQEKQLLGSHGEQEAESLAIYGNDEINMKILASRLSGLSEMTARLVKEKDISETLLIGGRPPLDTELSQEEAASSAQLFLREMREVFAGYGYSYFNDVPAGIVRNTGKGTDQPEDLKAELVISSDDASLSLWRIDLGNYVVIMDAVSGVPLYIGGDLSDTDVPFTKCEPYGLLWIAASRAYNSCYALGIDLVFPPKSESDSFLEETYKIYTWSGQGEFYNLEANSLQDEKDDTFAFDIWLFERKMDI